MKQEEYLKEINNKLTEILYAMRKIKETLDDIKDKGVNYV